MMVVSTLKIFASLLLCTWAFALRRGSRPSTHKAVKHHKTPRTEPEFDVTADEWEDNVTEDGFQQLTQAQLEINRGTHPYATSLCMDGKLVPKVYLLGAQKSATTSLAFDLMKAGIKSAAGRSKEWGMLESGASRDEWLEQLPFAPRMRQLLMYLQIL